MKCVNKHKQDYETNKDILEREEREVALRRFDVTDDRVAGRRWDAPNDDAAVKRATEATARQMA